MSTVDFEALEPINCKWTKTQAQQTHLMNVAQEMTFVPMREVGEIGAMQGLALKKIVQLDQSRGSYPIAVAWNGFAWDRYCVLALLSGRGSFRIAQFFIDEGTGVQPVLVGFWQEIDIEQ